MRLSFWGSLYLQVTWLCVDHATQFDHHAPRGIFLNINQRDKLAYALQTRDADQETRCLSGASFKPG